MEYPVLKKVVPFCLFLLVFIHQACAQPPQHSINQQWLQQQKAIAASTILLNNKQKLIPIKNLQQKIASVNIGTGNAAIFDSLLNKYALVDNFFTDTTGAAYNNLSIDLKFYNTVIVQLNAILLLQKSTMAFLYDVQKSKQLLLVVYGDAGMLAYAANITAPIILAMADDAGSANFTAQLIFGGVPASGKLTAKISKRYRKKDGYATNTIRLKYTVAEEAGIDIDTLQHAVDSLVADAIQQKAVPGAVVMAVKDGKVIFDKAYGKHTYQGSDETTIADIFDMASITKVSASTMAVMRLYEEKKIALDSTFGYYFAPARNTNKSTIKVRDLLLHQSGIAPGVVLPLVPEDVSADSSADYPIKTSDTVYLRKNYFKDVILPRMLDVAVDTPKYVYSDLSMTYMKEVIENQSGTRLDEYVATQFYSPLGMQSAGFNPLRRFKNTRVVPTERDADFRKGLIHGYVHDPMAAKYGGVSGNAGLFTNANDLAILYQMILNEGSYGGEKYFKPATIQLFTSKQSAISRRGLGFDRKDTSSELGYPSKLAAPQTYGHTGFTGTCFWVDPTCGLVFIFLSNRVYPTATSTLYKLRTQANILDTFYKAINKVKDSK